MKTSALIFDLDGTLVDSLPGISASLNRALTGHGLPGHSDAQVRTFIGDGAEMLVNRAIQAGAANPARDSILQGFAADYKISWASGTRPYAGIPQLLARLQQKGVPMAVLSNKPHAYTVEIVQQIFPQITISQVVGQQEATPLKPHPEAAIQLAAALRVPTEECIFIGDSAIDIDTAKNAKMQSIGVTWGYHDPERLAHADYLVDNVGALERLLESLT